MNHEQQMFAQALALSAQWDRMARVPLGDPLGFLREKERFWEMIGANGFQPPRWSAESEPVSRLRPGGRPSLSQERG